MAPTLLTLYLAAVLETMSVKLSKGVYIRTRLDGKLFNLARLRSSRRTLEVCVRELLFADDWHLLQRVSVTCRKLRIDLLLLLPNLALK